MDVNNTLSSLFKVKCIVVSNRFFFLEIKAQTVASSFKYVLYSVQIQSKYLQIIIRSFYADSLPPYRHFD